MLPPVPVSVIVSCVPLESRSMAPSRANNVPSVVTKEGTLNNVVIRPLIRPKIAAPMMPTAMASPIENPWPAPQEIDDKGKGDENSAEGQVDFATSEQQHLPTSDHRDRAPGTASS